MDQGWNGFRWQHADWGEILVCEPLLAVAAHVFTTRQLAIGPTSGELRRGYDAVARHLGVPPNRIFDARQVHGADVSVASARMDVQADRPAADILASADPDLAIVIRTADCVPILLADRRRGAVAAVHAGWRGTCAGAVRAAVAALGERFGSRPSNLIAAIGPSIGPSCYQVGLDVHDAFVASGGYLQSRDTWFLPDGNSWRLDLWSANRDQLLAAGLPEGAVYLAGECTASLPERYHSYRREGAHAGRLLAAIRPGEADERLTAASR